MTKQIEIAELVDYFHNNVDEAEQFSDIIKTLIYGCDKNVLIDILKELTNTVEHNLNFEKENHYSKYNDCFSNEIEDVEEKLALVHKILDK